MKMRIGCFSTVVMVRIWEPGFGNTILIQSLVLAPEYFLLKSVIEWCYVGDFDDVTVMVIIMMKILMMEK